MVRFNQRIQVVFLFIADCYHLKFTQFFLKAFRHYYGYFFIIKYTVRNKIFQLIDFYIKNSKINLLLPFKTSNSSNNSWIMKFFFLVIIWRLVKRYTINILCMMITTKIQFLISVRGNVLIISRFYWAIWIYHWPLSCWLILFVIHF